MPWAGEVDDHANRPTDFRLDGAGLGKARGLTQVGPWTGTRSVNSKFLAVCRPPGVGPAEARTSARWGAKDCAEDCQVAGLFPQHATMMLFPHFLGDACSREPHKLGGAGHCGGRNGGCAVGARDDGGGTGAGLRAGAAAAAEALAASKVLPPHWTPAWRSHVSSRLDRRRFGRRFAQGGQTAR